MGVLAESMRELVAAMQANEQRQRDRLENDLQSIIDGLERVSQGLTEVTDEMTAMEEEADFDE